MATKIVGIENMTFDELHHGISEGGRFVYYQYAISIIVMTFRRSSDIFWIAPGQPRVSKSLPYSAITLLLGWWGIPWGPIYSIGSLFANFSGGNDVTDAVWLDLTQHLRSPATPARRLGEAETNFEPPEDK